MRVDDATVLWIGDRVPWRRHRGWVGTRAYTLVTVELLIVCLRLASAHFATCSLSLDYYDREMAGES